MPASTRFWDRIAERYARKAVPNESVYQEKLRITRTYLTPEMAVLEFGCGSGTTSISHAAFVRQINGIDSSAKMIQIARAKAAAASIANATFEQASIESYNSPDETYDAVLALSVLHLLEDKLASLRKIHRLLKPGGVFVSSTPCLGNVGRPLRVIANAAASLTLIPHIHFFTPEQHLASLQATGFSVLSDWRPNQGRTLFVIAQKT
jgi:2-polyprenyl-3-methyl-5-hydroxy-6-metoxy-1,4-benzoquinol methylase